MLCFFITLFVILISLAIYYGNKFDMLNILKSVHSLIFIISPKNVGSAQLKRGNKLIVSYDYEGISKQVILKFTAQKKEWTKVFDKDIDGVETDVTDTLERYCDPNRGFFTGMTPEILGYDSLTFYYRDPQTKTFGPKDEILL